MANRKKTPSADGMVELRFNAEPHHKLVVGDQETNGGGTIIVDEATAKELLAADWANVTVADPKTPSWPDDDETLDELAAKLKVELPTVPAGGGIPEPTVADKIAALEAAGFTPATALAAPESTTSDDAQAS